MAQTHIRYMKEEDRFDIVAICDVDSEAMARVGDQLGITDGKRYIDYKQLIEDSDVDVVVSVTPNNVHADIVEGCLRTRKPFMSEKPFTRIFEEAVPLLEMYEQRPVPAMFGFSYRYTPAFRYARELIREGKIGTVSSFSIQYLQGWSVASKNIPYVWRFNKDITGSGTLGDLGSHMIDMARFLFGEFEELSAQMHTIVSERTDPITGSVLKVEVDDFASFQGRLTGDIMGVFQTTRNAVGSGNQHEVSIYGDIGTIHVSTLEPERLVWISEDESSRVSRTTLDVPNRCKVTQYADFIAVLEGNVLDGTPSFMDAYRNQEVLDAIIRANDTKTVIRLNV